MNLRSSLIQNEARKYSMKKPEKYKHLYNFSCLSSYTLNAK